MKVSLIYTFKLYSRSSRYYLSALKVCYWCKLNHFLNKMWWTVNVGGLISCRRLSTSWTRLLVNQARSYSSTGLLTQDEKQRFQEDGVVCLRGKFSEEWLDKLRRGIRKNFDNPSPFSEKLSNRDDPKSFFFNDYWNYPKIAEFSDFVFYSPAAEFARQLMVSEKVAFYHEHVFTKDPGTCFATPWHHDQAYYPLDGWKNCSFWMPLSAVTKENCLKYIKGSHCWGKWFIPKKFETNLNYSFGEEKEGRFSEMVDIDANGQFEELSWDLEPGDCIAFHMLTVHGAPESLDLNGRQVLATRWLGDDIVIATRPWELSPPFLPEGSKVGNSVFHYPSFFPVIKQAVHV